MISVPPVKNQSRTDIMLEIMRPGTFIVYADNSFPDTMYQVSENGMYYHPVIASRGESGKLKPNLFRVATLSEVTIHRRFHEAEILPALDTKIGNVFRDSRLLYCIGNGEEFSNKLLDNSIPALDRIKMLEQVVHNFNNNAHIRHIQLELPYATKYDPVKYCDRDLQEALRFFKPIAESIHLTAHSGSSIKYHVSLIKRIIHEVANKETVISWSSFRHEESKHLEGTSIFKSVFHPTMTPSSVFRMVLSLSQKQAYLLAELVTSGILFENLTPLTLEDDEWVKSSSCYRNIRNESVLKAFPTEDEPNPKPYYVGIAFCDNPELQGFFGTKDSRLLLEPNEDLKTICVYLKYPMPVEVGTFPDGDLTQYAYIPEPIPLAIGQEVRKFDHTVYKVEQFSDSFVTLRSFGKGIDINLTMDEFKATDSINGMVYPVWQILPEELPIELLD